jgi:hypothetical protein
MYNPRKTQQHYMKQQQEQTKTNKSRQIIGQSSQNKQNSNKNNKTKPTKYNPIKINQSHIPK